MSATPNPKITAVVAETLQNAEVIVSAFNHVGPNAQVGFTLAACCAMVQNESGGRMIWGADPWVPGSYPKGPALPSEYHEVPVTQANYQAYKARRNEGMQPQGCGIAQLTSTDLQIEAEKAGGCWVPFYNCLVGFKFLKGLFVEHGSAFTGFEAYNGSGPAAIAYASRAVALQESWQVRFNHALRV